MAGVTPASGGSAVDVPVAPFLFIGGLHRSGTSLLHRLVATHPDVSGFSGTGVPEDEGQHLQRVYPPALALGGAGRFALDPRSHMTDEHPLATPASRDRLLADWSPWWDLSRPVLAEKSPPNMVRTRFLQALFPDAAFVVITRDPVVVALATRKWAKLPLDDLVANWVAAHRTWRSDRPHVRRALEVRYEDLVADPGAVVEAVWAHVGLTARPLDLSEVRAGTDDHYLAQWSGVPAAERDRTADRFGAAVRDLGYELPPPGPAPAMPRPT